MARYKADDDRMARKPYSGSPGAGTKTKGRTKPRPKPSSKSPGAMTSSRGKKGPDPVKSTLAAFSKYASSGGRLKPGSAAYEARLKALRSGIMDKREMADKTRRSTAARKTAARRKSR